MTIRGIIDGIISGDSVVVRFVDPAPDPLVIVSLEHLVAPKFGSNSGNIVDHPYGFDSWEYLRSICIGARVYVVSYNHQSDIFRTHPSFGRLRIIFRRITMADQPGVDVGLQMVRNGWAQLRSVRIVDDYVQQLKSAEQLAKSQGLGIWNTTPGTIRRLPVQFENRDIVLRCEIRALVESVINGTTLSLFLLPKNELIIFQIAGCCAPSIRPDRNSACGKDSRNFTVRCLLHRYILIRVASYSVEADRTIFLGSIVDQNDRAIEVLIERGLAHYFKRTADHAPNVNQYVRAELAARQKKLGIWADQSENYFEPYEFDAVVRYIRQDGLAVDRKDIPMRRTVRFNGIDVPIFDGVYYSQPWGFEAREFLRNNFIGHTVHCLIEMQVDDRLYGTILTADGRNIAEILISHNLAQKASSPIGNPTNYFTQLPANTIPPGDNFILIDNQVPEFRQVFDGIIEYATVDTTPKYNLGPKFIILLPQQRYLIRTFLYGLHDSAQLKSSSFDGNIKRYIQADVRIEVIEEKKKQLYSRITCGRLDLALVAAYPDMAPIRIIACNVVKDDVVVSIQKLTGEMTRIESTLASLTTTPVPPNAVMVGCDVANEGLARARIVGQKWSNSMVELIDHGLSFGMPTASLFAIPDSIAFIEPQGTAVYLVGVRGTVDPSLVTKQFVGLIAMMSTTDEGAIIILDDGRRMNDLIIAKH